MCDAVPVDARRWLRLMCDPAGRILSVEPGVQLTGTIMGAAMSYVLLPAADGTTRLLLKLVTARGRTFAPLLSPGDLVMARKQLRTWRSWPGRTRSGLRELPRRE